MGVGETPSSVPYFGRAIICLSVCLSGWGKTLPDQSDILRGAVIMTTDNTLPVGGTPRGGRSLHGGRGCQLSGDRD